MAITFTNSQIGYCDDKGNITVISPYTKAENVDYGSTTVKAALDSLSTTCTNLNNILGGGITAKIISQTANGIDMGFYNKGKSSYFFKLKVGTQVLILYAATTVLTFMTLDGLCVLAFFNNGDSNAQPSAYVVGSAIKGNALTCTITSANIGNYRLNYCIGIYYQLNL